ncbi:MAG TPA: class I SAM-dependent methyltransferase [Thermoanaerobaculia bacterium]|nr:class I SAM-dependent methyltransferase [Thermoanaerobaculia bacterium]
MASQRDLTGELVEEIRAAVAQASPAAGVPPIPVKGLPEGEEVRASLARALQYITPAVPPAVRLSRSKRFLLRALRFLWRDQVSFNALVLEVGRGLADRLDAAWARSKDALDAERGERERQFNQWREATERGIDRAFSDWERRAAIQDGRLAILEAGQTNVGAALTGSPEAGGQAPSPMPAGVYSLFEERFRGSPQDIAEKQRAYLPLLRGLPGPVLDVGCGRGELLHLLAAQGIPASGVEINPIAASACREEGLSIEEGDGLAILSSRPDGSLGGIVALQVVEHWRVEAVFALLREARRKLAPGGVLIAESINTDSLSSLKAFFLDPSHVRPVPAEALEFLARAAGFTDTRIEYRSPLPERERLEESSENDAKLNRLLFGPQDYALVAYAPR